VRDNYFGESNAPLMQSLTMLKVADKGVENAITLSSNLRGILKSTKSMLAEEDRKKAKDDFIADYVGMSNASGIASLDSTQEFTPVDMSPKMPAAQHVALFEKRIMRYHGTSEPILLNEYNETQWASFYEGSIEPFLIQLSQETANKVFSRHARGHGNMIVYESNRMQYLSAQSKFMLVSLIDRGLLTINEYRDILNLPPVDGGDARVIRKEYAAADDVAVEPLKGGGENAV